jgi:hypothetical protein
MLSGTPIVNQSVVRVSVESNLKLIKISQNIKISLRRVGGSCVKTDGYQTAHTGHRTFEFCTDNRDTPRTMVPGVRKTSWRFDRPFIWFRNRPLNAKIRGSPGAGHRIAGPGAELRLASLQAHVIRAHAWDHAWRATRAEAECRAPRATRGATPQRASSGRSYTRGTSFGSSAIV